MEKRIALFVTVFLALIAPSAHAIITDWNVVVSIEEDRRTLWNVTLLHSEYVTKSDYFVFADILEYSVVADSKSISCELTKNPGSLIVCNGINARNITYSFRTNQLAVDVLQNFRMFTYKFPVTSPAARYRVTVYLPLGSALADEASLKGTLLNPFEPDFGRQGSDGRRIFVSWELEKPRLGDSVDIAIVFERVLQSEDTQFRILAAVIVVVIGAVIFVTRFIRKTPKHIFPVLTENERKVMQILIREKGEVDQRIIVKETDFSKAKVSRIIKELSDRGLVEKIGKGRKNVIRMKKTIKQENIQKEENKEKSSKK